MYYALLSGEPWAVAGVGPVFRRFDESGSYGIPVDVRELFCELGARDDVEVVVTLLPERFLRGLLADGNL